MAPGFHRQAHSKPFAIQLGWHDFIIFGTWLTGCPSPSLRKATSKRAKRDPTDTALSSSVQLLRIHHTQSTKHTCTSWAAPEELLQDPALDKEWGFPLAEQLWKQKKKEFCGILWQIIKIAALPLRTCAAPTDHRACAVLSDEAQRPKYFSSATFKPQGTKRNSSEHLPPGQCRARLLVLGSLKMHFKPKTDLIPA